MLIVKVFVNKKQIDEICIQNKGEHVNGLTVYEHKESGRHYHHQRDNGYIPLLIEVLKDKNNSSSK